MIEIDFETSVVEISRRVLVKDRLAFAFETAEQETTAFVVAHVDATVKVVNDRWVGRDAERFENEIVVFARVHLDFHSRITQLAQFSCSLISVFCFVFVLIF